MNEVYPIKDIRDIERMKSALAASPRDLLLFIVGINSSLRISDLLRLKVGDISDSHIYMTESKTGKRKRIKINSSIRRAASELIPDNASSDDWLFPSRSGGNPISRSQAWRILNKAARLAGIKSPIGTHSLRKTFAYHAYSNGASLPVLMRVLNHGSQRETLRYIGIEAEQIDEIYIDICL